jgi:hypothetical protein
MKRLDPLDVTLANAYGFRALLQDLHGRDQSTVSRTRHHHGRGG